MTTIDPDLEQRARSARNAEIARNSQADDDDLRGELAPRPLTHRAQLQLWKARRLRALRTRNHIALVTATRRGVEIPQPLAERIADPGPLDLLILEAEMADAELRLEKAYLIEQSIRNALAIATLKQRDPKRCDDANLTLDPVLDEALASYEI